MQTANNYLNNQSCNNLSLSKLDSKNSPVVLISGKEEVSNLAALAKSINKEVEFELYKFDLEIPKASLKEKNNINIIKLDKENSSLSSDVKFIKDGALEQEILQNPKLLEGELFVLLKGTIQSLNSQENVDQSRIFSMIKHETGNILVVTNDDEEFAKELAEAKFSDEEGNPINYSVLLVSEANREKFNQILHDMVQQYVAYKLTPPVAAKKNDLEHTDKDQENLLLLNNRVIRSRYSSSISNVSKQKDSIKFLSSIHPSFFVLIKHILDAHRLMESKRIERRSEEKRLYKEIDRTEIKKENIKFDNKKKDIQKQASHQTVDQNNVVKNEKEIPPTPVKMRTRLRKKLK
jgi:hypothetical protein